MLDGSSTPTETFDGTIVTGIEVFGVFRAFSMAPIPPKTNAIRRVRPNFLASSTELKVCPVANNPMADAIPPDKKSETKREMIAFIFLS